MKQLTEGTKAMIYGKEYTLTDVQNVTQPGSCGPDELLYTFEGWGDLPVRLVDYEVDNLVVDGAFSVRD